MNIQTLQTTAIDRYLRTVQAPIRMAAKLIGGENTRQGSALFIDRADATVRRAVGRLLNNDELQADANARLAAAEERERAIELRAAADRKNAQADSEFTDAQREAEHKRVETKERAERQQAQIEKTKSEQEQRIEREERQRKAVVADAKTQADEALEIAEKKKRLDQLNSEAEALAAKEAALDTNEEAHRLKQSAAATKARRKL